ncbi:MAG TPA: Hsp20/alpha crystallin family protein [Acidimicrobiia bacterium]|jgi:HSP20 family protein
MELKVLAPFFDIDKEWRLFDFPSFLHKADMAFRPSIDVLRSNGDLIVTAEVPGIEPENLEVTLEGDILAIKGEKSAEKEISDDDRYLHERSYGKFLRRIPMPEGVSADKMFANYDKGVLTVRITMPEELPKDTRSIPVEVTIA